VAMMHCGAIYTDTKNVEYVNNPSDSSELYLYLTYAAGIKGITVYRCFSEENSQDEMLQNFKYKARKRDV